MWMQLYAEIGRILGVDRGLKTILIGAGNLGRAIATHMSFEARGFNLIGIFDKNEAMAGQLVRGLPVRHVDGLDDFLPGSKTCWWRCCAFQATTRRRSSRSLSSSALKAFGTIRISILRHIIPDVAVENVHLSDSLMTLSYQMSTKF